MPVVTAPAMKVNVVTAAAVVPTVPGTIAAAVVQIIVSAVGTARTVVPVPAVSTHVAVAATLVPATVLALVESTALKYLDGNAMVIFPPMGTAVTGLKLKVTTPVFTVAGTLSTAAVSVANTNAVPSVRVAPRAGHAFALPSLSVEDDTVYVPAPWGSNPNVMEPMAKVRSELQLQEFRQRWCKQQCPLCRFQSLRSERRWRLSCRRM